MAGSSVQGFVKLNNLRENTLDRQALNNLGTAPIADDLSLFINNNNNSSVLPIRLDEYDRINGLIIINNQTTEDAANRAGIFTNGDVVKITNTDGGTIKDNLYVAFSDGERSFGFATDPDLENKFTFFPNEDFIVVRNDRVVLENFVNLGVEQTTASFNTGLNDDTGSGTILSETYAEAFSNIYSYLDIAKFQSQKKFLEDRDVNTDDDFVMEGIFEIEDPSNMIVLEGINPNSPGLYITNPNSPLTNIQRIRAFSDTQNPWEDTGTALETQSVDVTTGDLKLNQGLEITGITKLEESGSVDSVTFTHKVAVTIDGVDYYLCLTG